MIRILQVVTSMDVGGIEVLLMNLYRHMDRSLIQFDFLLHRPQETHFDKEIVGLGGRIFRVSPINPLRQRKYLNELDEFFNAHRDYLIVHAHVNAFSMFILRAGKKAGIPVCIAHSHIADVPFSFSHTIFRNYCRLKINDYADYAFACSVAAGKWLYGKGILNDSRFHLLLNAIEYGRFSYNEGIRNDVRKELGIENQLVIGHIGRFNQQKNHSYLVRIFSKIALLHPDSVLLLIGEGELREEMERHVRSLNLQTKVKFLGVRTDVSRLFQAMDLFLFPSLYEGLGIVLIEAQAAGLPCLASDSVPEEAKATDLLEFMSLKATADKWAEEVMQRVNSTSRKDRSHEVAAAGYDIAANARWLQDFYLARHWEALEQKR